MGSAVGNVAPQRFNEDFVIGRISLNHTAVMGCQVPVAGIDEKIMARTNEECDYMSRNLVAVVWLE